VVVGTIDAHRQPAQLELVEAIVATGTPVVAVALRGPWDVAFYPPTATALATYSILPAPSRRSRPCWQASRSRMAGFPLPSRMRSRSDTIEP
jgi:hypothetical protein